jgi:hypothetical protein
MNQSGKIVLGLLALGGIGAIVFMSQNAHAESAGAGPSPGPLPAPPSPLLPPLGSDPISLPPSVVIPPAGTPVPLPGGGSVPVPTIPGVNTGGAQPLPSLPSLPNLPPLGSDPLSLPPIAPVLPTVPGPPPPVSAPPASPAEVTTSAPADTVALVTKMLAQEANPHWRIIPEPLLVAWQKARGLTADGDFGTGTALKLAQEIGTIPIIRGWPKGSTPGDGKMTNYQASLQQIANSAPEPRASQLRASAAREAGQGYGTPEKPILHLITLQS